MWADTGSILLGSVLLVFGTDSLAQGVSGLLVRKAEQAWLRTLVARWGVPLLSSACCWRWRRWQLRCACACRRWPGSTPP